MLPRRRNIDSEEPDGIAASDAESSLSTTTSLASLPATPSKTTPNHKSGCSKNMRLSILMITLLAAMGLHSRRDLLWEEEEQDYGKSREKYRQQQQEKYSTLDHYIRSDTQPSGKFVLKSDTEFKPGIAWLLTFPNSGTSYTMSMVARATNKSFATNYGAEVISPEDENSVSIYPRRPEGPYWPGPKTTVHTPRPLPGDDQFVITKTHCGSRCVNCGPDEYIELADYFLERCASGHGLMTPGKDRRSYDVQYPSNRVQRAIHLYRNPLHNIIARYNFERRHMERKNKTQTLPGGDFTKDAQGLHHWCEWLRRDYLPQDVAYYGSQDKIPKAVCHGEFTKWTQWHNHANTAIRTMREGGPEGGPRREVPVLTIYYEDYNTKFEETATSILDFLKLQQVAPFREFSSRSDYGSYFSLEEQVEIRRLVRSVASNETWTDIRHYFEGIPDEWNGDAATTSEPAETQTSSTENVTTTTTTNGNATHTRVVVANPPGR